MFHYCPCLILFHYFAAQGRRPALAETLEPVHGGDGELVLVVLVPPEALAAPGGLPGPLGGGGLGGLLPPPLPHQARLAQDGGEAGGEGEGPGLAVHVQAVILPETHVAGVEVGAVVGVPGLPLLRGWWCGLAC